MTRAAGGYAQFIPLPGQRGEVIEFSSSNAVCAARRRRSLRADPTEETWTRHGVASAPPSSHGSFRLIVTKDARIVVLAPVKAQLTPGVAGPKFRARGAYASGSHRPRCGRRDGRWHRRSEVAMSAVALQMLNPWAGRRTSPAVPPFVGVR